MKIEPIPRKAPPAEPTNNGRVHNALLNLQPVHWLELSDSQSQNQVKNGQDTYEENF